MILTLNDVESIQHLSEELPKNCIKECARSGDTYCACKSWVRHLSLNIPRDLCISELRKYAFDDLEDDSDEELNIKFLWLAAGYNT